jgi:hypothetical protein
MDERANGYKLMEKEEKNLVCGSMKRLRNPMEAKNEIDRAVATNETDQRIKSEHNEAYGEILVEKMNERANAYKLMENEEDNLACASREGSGDPLEAKSDTDQAVGMSENDQRIKIELKEAHCENLIKKTDERATAYKLMENEGKNSVCAPSEGLGNLKEATREIDRVVVPSELDQQIKTKENEINEKIEFEQMDKMVKASGITENGKMSRSNENDNPSEIMETGTISQLHANDSTSEIVEKEIIRQSEQSVEQKKMYFMNENEKSYTKNVRSNQQKHRIYRINHSNKMETELKKLPFTFDQNEKTVFVEFRNHTSNALTSPRNVIMPKIKSFEVWDPGIETTMPVKTVPTEAANTITPYPPLSLVDVIRRLHPPLDKI